jgi:hypothetical protein
MEILTDLFLFLQQECVAKDNPNHLHITIQGQETAGLCWKFEISSCLGAIKTGMTKMIEENETMLKQTPMVIPAGRMGGPIDIANAALYLASGESNYVTGTSIVVDGRWLERRAGSRLKWDPPLERTPYLQIHSKYRDILFF